MEMQPLVDASSNVADTIKSLKKHLTQAILGQSHLIDCLLCTLLTNGHLLVEGAPGLAKTRLIKVLGDVIEGDFHRIQFTPDLLPADITGTDIYRPEEGNFTFQPGPIFHHLILADEINRAPAKVQSALLEAMAERQVTIGKKTYPLPQLFLVMATQNHIEQEGTYPLPEAQLDRFQLQVNIDYPDAATEKAILRLNRQEVSAPSQTAPLVTQAQLFAARDSVQQLHLAENVEDYLVALTMATRHPEKYDPQLSAWIVNGVSPRGTIALENTAKAYAWLQGRDYVSPGDVQAIVKDVFRHRLLLSFEAHAEGMTSDTLIERLLNFIAVP